MLYFERAQCLGQVSINFIRINKPDGVAAERALVEKQSKPRVQTLLPS